MTTETFLSKLANNPNKALVFEYAPNAFVAANYHITEVKHTTIDSVDCGGVSHTWKETVVQLWESPKETEMKAFIKTSKALEIFQRVNSIKPLLLDTEIKMEYGNKHFHTAQLKIKNIVENDKKLIVQLHADTAACKASDTCGIQPEVEEETTASCCTPNSGCC